MSKAFEQRLAARTAAYFKEHPPEPGERFVGQFENSETVSRLATEFIEATGTQSVTLNIKGSDVELPAFPVSDDVTIIPLRVRSSEYDIPLEAHEIFQGFATRLRDFTSSGGDDAGLSLMLFYENSVGIDTLESASPTPLYSSNGLLSLESLWTDIFSSDSALSIPANALLGALSDHLGDFEAHQLDIGLLRTLCRIRELLENENYAEIPDTISDLGTYLRADGFEPAWFNEDENKNDLERKAFKLLEDNQAHAERIANSKAVGTMPSRELEGEYKPEFIQLVEKRSLEEIDHSEAEKNKIIVPSTDKPKFKSFDIEATGFKRKDVADRANGRSEHKAAVAVVADGELTIKIEFDKEVPETTGTRLRDSNKNEVGTVSISDATVTATKDSLSPSEDEYLSLEIYIGQDNRMGYPECQFDIAVLPRWFYDATLISSIEVDYEQGAVVSQKGATVTLRHDSDETERTESVTEDGKHVTFDGQIELEPAQSKEDRFTCYITSEEDDGDPVTLQLRPDNPEIIDTGGTGTTGAGGSGSEEDEDEIINRHSDVHLPLHLNVIGAPDIWGRDEDDLMIDSGLSYLVDDAAFETSSVRVSVSSLQEKRLAIERQIRGAESIAPRSVNKDDLLSASVDADAPPIPNSLRDAYDDLFAHLQDNDRVPSTDAWGEDMLGAVEDILEVYLQELGSVESGLRDDYSIFRDLGTISIEGTDKEWLTPYHPLMLAYGYKIATWRDTTLLPEDRTAGFKEDATYSMFSPIGLLPYRYGTQSDDLLHGFTEDGCHLWAKYSGVDTVTSDTPPYMEDDITRKLESFTQTFRPLFELHPDRPLNINLVKMGDLEPIIAGLYTFYKREYNADRQPPRVLLRVIGPEGQAEQLERFFDEDADSMIREQLPDNRIRRALIESVSYTQSTPDAPPEEQDAHLTFFRGVLQPEFQTEEASKLGSSFRMDGLIPQEAVDVFHRDDETISHSGFGDDEHDDQILARVARNLNSLEPVANKQSFDVGESLRQEIRSEGGSLELKRIWEDSIWASHVEPPVRLDFYMDSNSSTSAGSDTAREHPLMIHYSDQYDHSSPGFDVITTTDKRELYTSALKQTLDQNGALAHASAEVVLEHLIAIDGSLALEIQQQDAIKTVELLGLIGGIAYSHAILNKFKSEYAWFPISLREIAQKDYSQRVGSGSGFKFENAGKASDDLCFVGLPKKHDSELEVKLWLVEAKGGTAQISDGRPQIKGAYDEFMQKLTPMDPVADGKIRRAELGQIITNIGRRLAHYGVYEPSTKRIEQYRDHLRNGDFEPTFLRDSKGSVGEIINVDPQREKADHDTSEYTRETKLPSTVVELLSEESRSIDEILKFIDISRLSFGPEGPAPEYAESTDDGEEEDAESADDVDDADGVLADAGGANESEEPSQNESEVEEDTASPDTSTEESDDETAEATGTGDGSSTESVFSEPQQDLAELEYRWEDSQFDNALAYLSQSPEFDVDLDIERLTAELKSQFDSLGIDIHPPDPNTVTIGPRKIGVNIRPKSGQRIKAIRNNLESLGVHIQAHGTISAHTNTGEGVVRLEIPHGQQQAIHLRNGLEALSGDGREPLTVPLGIDTSNTHHQIDLLEQRHLLIGGTTGSGKSNFLMSLVSSLALEYAPNELTMSLLDPKGIDFQTFAALPHVGESQYIDSGVESVEYLLELVETTMPERQNILQDSPASTIQQYNQMPGREPEERVPYHVVVIDEFADLILGLEDDREEFIEAVQRLTQMGRAFGISLVIATQRPSADVVPGEIKANLPARLSFELPSNTDSRVILDQPGAEDLEGAGDMLVKPRTGGELHLQSYFVPPVDVATVNNMLSQNRD